MLDLTRRRAAERLTDEFRSGAAHAGRYETSIVRATRPELVDTERMSALPERPVNMPAAIAAGKTDFLAMGMDEAYCGAPAEAVLCGRGRLRPINLTMREAIRPSDPRACGEAARRRGAMPKNEASRRVPAMSYG